MKANTGNNIFKTLLILTICILFTLSSSISIAQESKAVLSSRTFHPRGMNDRLNTIAVIKKMKPNRVDWTYSISGYETSKYKELGLPFSLAINPQIPDSDSYTTPKYRIIDIFGKPYIPSRMKRWGVKNPYWGCVNNPLFKKLFFERTMDYVNLGPYAIFVDDPIFNVQVQKDGGAGCFCKYCKASYEIWQRNGKNVRPIDYEKIANDIDIDELTDQDNASLEQYKRFQEASVVKFLKDWKAAVLVQKPTLKFLCNNYRGEWNQFYEVFDGGIAEIPLTDLNIARLDKIFKTADSLHKSQLLTLAASNVDAQNYLLAYCHLKNREFIIPWDVYAPAKNKAKNRFYGNLDEIEQLLANFKTNKIRVEISDKAFSSKEINFCRLEDRDTYQVMLLNKVPIKGNGKAKRILDFARKNALFIGIGGGTVLAIIIAWAFVRAKNKKRRMTRRQSAYKHS